MQCPLEHHRVSIRSRLVQAGERTYVDLAIKLDGFNPLPPCSGGRTPHGVSDNSERLFQSAPALFRRENPR